MFLTYLRCPDQALARLGGAYPIDSRTSFRGGLAHRVFARHLSTGPIPADGFEQACREEIGQGLNQKIGSLHLRPSDLAGVISEVGELYQRFQRMPMDEFSAAEVFIEVEPSPGVVLRGSIDAVFEQGAAVRLVDWKTGQLGQSQDQLWFYAMLWALDHGVLPSKIEAMSVATGERWEAVPSRAEVAATVERVTHLVRELRLATASGDHLAKDPGPWCRFCPVLDECDEGRTAAAVFTS